MANLPSAKKAIRKTKTRTVRNKPLKRRIKDLLKKTKELIQQGDKVLAQEYFDKTGKALDKGAKNNIIHKNKASRHKSQLSKAIAALGDTKAKKSASKKTDKKTK